MGSQDAASTVDGMWVIIPARGGSVTVPRKNVRMLAGRPLIAHTIGTALTVLPGDRVVVVTDDREIQHVAEQHGATVIFEQDRTPGTETLDTKVLRNLPRLREMGADSGDIVATVQPTSPLLRAATLLSVRDELLAGGRSALTVAEDRHLRWRIGDDGDAQPLFAARVNRQELPMEYRETGGVIAARLGDIEQAATRIIPPVRLVPVPDDEATDIDTFTDLYAAAHLASRLRILIRADAATHLGMGHIYRATAIAAELARHDLRIVTSAQHELGGRFLAGTPYPTATVEDDDEFTAMVGALAPDIVVLDVLNTDAAFVDALHAASPATKIVTFEDQGSGAGRADLLVSEFVDNHDVPGERQLTGAANAILSPPFETVVTTPTVRPEVEEILVLFGGTDPSGLARRALDALRRAEFRGRVTVVRGLGAHPLDLDGFGLDAELLTDVKNMPAVIARADLAFTSAGRTVLELATLGVPSICLAQNAKELSHTHATEDLGVTMLGLGSEVGDDEIDTALVRLLIDAVERRRLHERALATMAERSNHRVLGHILDRLGFDPFPNL